MRYAKLIKIATVGAALLLIPRRSSVNAAIQPKKMADTNGNESTANEHNNKEHTNKEHTGKQATHKEATLKADR